MKPEVLIYSDKVGRGKTTALKNWSNNQNGIGGVFSPKIEGRRFFEFLSSHDLLDMESEHSTLQIGKYSFDAGNFVLAEKRILEDWQNQNIHTVIIDEIGPLEIRKNQGFHQLLNRLLSSEITQAKRLVLVVRDNCLWEFFRTYPCKNAKIITEIDLQEKALYRPVGIVLCGGNSRRMQADKALVNYHGSPQWQHVYELLSPFCEKVYLSLNANQSATWGVADGYDIIKDSEDFLNHGPMTGIMSALQVIRNNPIFIVACDYPLLQMENLLELYKNRSLNSDVVCFQDRDQPEPLISIIEIAACQNLENYFKGGRDSIAKFIGESNAQYLEVLNPDFLRNANKPEELEWIKKQLKND